MTDSQSSSAMDTARSPVVVPTIISCKDPLYFHPSDSPGLQLVTNTLTLTNYLIWSRSMRIALKAKNKLCFVDGSCSQPEDVTSEGYAQWSFVDSMVVS